MSALNESGYDYEDEKVAYESILAHMLEAYAQGASEARIYTGNEFAYRAITIWSRGWIRKAGEGGVWKNSRGEAIKYQSKIQMILALNRRIPLQLFLVKHEILNNPLYGKIPCINKFLQISKGKRKIYILAIQFNATELIQG